MVRPMLSPIAQRRAGNIPRQRHAGIVVAVGAEPLRSTKGGEYSPPTRRRAGSRRPRRPAPLNEGRGIFPANASERLIKFDKPINAQRRAGNIPRQRRTCSRRRARRPAALNEGRGIFPANAVRQRRCLGSRAAPLNEGRGIFPANAAACPAQSTRSRSLNEGRGIFPANALGGTR